MVTALAIDNRERCRGLVPSCKEPNPTMAETLILRAETALPADVRALLHGALPEGVWHLPSHPRLSNPFRFATAASLVVLVAMMGLFFITVFTASRFRSEGFTITLGLVLFSAGIHWLCRRGKARAVRLDEDLKADRVRYGLWITPNHVVVRDLDEGIRCVRSLDIANTHIYRSGHPPFDLLVLTMTNRQTVRILVNGLDGWTGQADRLHKEVERRLFAKQGKN